MEIKYTIHDRDFFYIYKGGFWVIMMKG
jgi:hypothetical protein